MKSQKICNNKKKNEITKKINSQKRNEKIFF